MVSQAELISKGYQPLVPGINLIFREGKGETPRQIAVYPARQAK